MLDRLRPGMVVYPRARRVIKVATIHSDLRAAAVKIRRITADISEVHAVVNSKSLLEMIAELNRIATNIEERIKP